MKSFGLALAFALGLGGQASRAEEITVFAASSLKTALDQVAADWQAATGNNAVIAYDSSAKLAKQIAGGGPADIFISASEAWMDAVQKEGLVKDGTRRDILGNTLVLIAHGQADPAEIGAGFDLAGRLGDGKLAMGMVASVPVGQYGKETLSALGLWDSVAANVVEADTARAALKLVATGEAPYGVVFASDAVAETGVTVIGTFPESSHSAILYPAAMMAGGKPAAEAFLDYLTQEPAQERFKAQGFRVIQQE